MIRSIAAADRAPIEAILRATGAFTQAEVTVALELVDAGTANAPGNTYQLLVAEDAGAVVGYVCFGATPLTEGVFDLYWIAVDPRRQGAGVGRALLEAVEAAARAQGGRMLLIETASKPSYDTTRAFYLARGYDEVARVPDFYKVGDDRVIYRKRLT